MRVALMVEDTGAEGPGRRFALWVQGCTIRCPQCCNPQMFEREGGVEHETEALAAAIASQPGLEGVSLLGGEPFEQPEALADLCERVQAAGLTVMIYTGYTLAQLKDRRDPATERALAACDLLVDGRFEAEQYETGRRWIGSKNQVLHFLTARYAPDDPRFKEANTVEVRVKNGEVIVTGWPTVGRPLVRAPRESKPKPG
jgi:anaerobic ribonucleoside-triphosphate reductase activating protein